MVPAFQERWADGVASSLSGLAWVSDDDRASSLLMIRQGWTDENVAKAHPCVPHGRQQN